MISRSKGIFIDRLAAGATFLLTVFFFLGSLAPFVNPRKAWLFAAAGLGYPFCLVGLSILLGYWLIRKSRQIFIPAACLLISFPVLRQYWGLRFQTAVSRQQAVTIRVMNYNVHGFRDLKSLPGTRIAEKMLITIHHEMPDILTMEDYNPTSTDQRLIYSSLCVNSKLPYHYFLPAQQAPGDSTGVAIFSRFPILEKGAVRPPTEAPEMSAAYADIQYRRKRFRVYVLHLQSVHFESQEHELLKKFRSLRRFQPAQLKLFLSKLKAGFVARSYQAATIKRHLSKCSTPFIVAGDFNDTPVSWTAHTIGKGLSNAFAEKGRGSAVTYHYDFPRVPIDYVLLSPRFRVLDAYILRNKDSDHYPVVAELTLGD